MRRSAARARVVLVSILDLFWGLDLGRVRLVFGGYLGMLSMAMVED